MTWGVPPVMYAAGSDLPGHGVFPTYFTELAFQLDTSSMVAAYDVQTGAAAGPPGHMLYLYEFDIDTNLFDPNIVLHFDLYTFNARDGILFAPFSHDAQSQSAPVPEPGTLLLLGSGLAALGAYSRRRAKR
ncbi:MAG: PEP-CTERM sorting domain-containing protein [Desulfuromonadaceae bacterium]|nr:PEP-CTERM sorting domain-containing protein [Desulfuromonadaceae bacterium]